MNIDADGAPNAYAPLGINHLDALVNAGESGNWYGIITDNGKRNGNPIIQGPNDPCPGCYVSSTALSDPNKHYTDPTKYVDSTRIPYISIPPEIKLQGSRLGDLCMVFYNDMMWPAIIADIGPHNKYGEASICLAQHLSIPPSPIHGGVDSGVTYVLFCDTSTGWPRIDLEDSAQNEFNKWGGLNQYNLVSKDL